MFKKTLITMALATTISSVGFAHPFCETIYYNDTLVKVANERGRTEALLDTNNCMARKYASYIEYQGNVHFVDGIKKVTIRFFKGQDDDWALIKHENEDFFREIKVDDVLFVNLYYHMVDFAKEL